MSPPPAPHALRAAATLAGALLLASLTAAAAEGQGFADRLRRKAENAAKRAVETRVERRADEGTRGVMDAAERGAKRAAGDAAGSDTAASGAARPAAPGAGRAAAGPAPAGGARAGGPAPNTAPNTASNAAPPAAAVRPGEGAWANYDFVPGPRVLFADDFTADRVGDFPRRLAYVNGSSELVLWQGRPWLRAGGPGDFAVPLPEVLPERFTLEFELAGSGNAMEIYFADPARHRGPVLRFDRTTGGMRGGGLNVAGQTGHDTGREPVAVRVQADGQHVKVYVGETRVANVPAARSAAPTGCGSD
jgi:hypothetical protein